MEYIDLKDYLKRLLDNWIIVLLCCIIGGTSAFIYSRFVATPMYSSTVKIGVYNSDWSNKSSTMNDIQASLGLIETCTVVLQDDVTSEAVSQLLSDESGIEISPKAVKASLSFSQIGESQWLKVEAKTADPELSALICNAVIAKAPQIIIDSVADIDIKSLGVAKVNYNPVSPSVVKNVIIGVVIALVLVGMVIFLVEFFDNTVRDEGKLVEKYDLSILGTIPNIYNSAKNAKGSAYAESK